MVHRATHPSLIVATADALHLRPLNPCQFPLPRLFSNMAASLLDVAAELGSESDDGDYDGENGEQKQRNGNGVPGVDDSSEEEDDDDDEEAARAVSACARAYHASIVDLATGSRGLHRG